MYEILLLRANRTVSSQLMMNISRWIVLSHCRVSNCCLSVYLTIAVLEKRFRAPESPGKVLEFL